jgi:hypothetical protein
VSEEIYDRARIRIVRDIVITDRHLPPDSRGAAALPQLIGKQYHAGDIVDIPAYELGVIELFFPDDYELVVRMT